MRASSSTRPIIVAPMRADPMDDGSSSDVREPPMDGRSVASMTQPSSLISEREAHEIERANASGRVPVVFIHGLWLLPSSWDRWAEAFAAAGYATVQADWPDDPETVEEAKPAKKASKAKS